MKNNILLVLLASPFLLFAQVHSWDGVPAGIKPNEKLHYLNIFVNIIYDVHPDINNNFDNPNMYWPTITNPDSEGINTAAIPTYLLDWMDTVYVPGQLHGTCTRLYGESSFDSLQITGDFVVVNLRESTILNHGAFDRYNIRDVAISMLEQNNSFTLFGHHNLTDFTAKNVLIRNITKNYGGLNPGSGSGGRNTLQCVGDGDLSTNPTCIVTHEISHGLFGTNNFHTSGGNHRGWGCSMSFLNVQGGYGLMGAAHSGLVGSNGYERWRMHWKHPQSVDYISARDATNTQSVASDITREDGNKTFLLRDFVTYGDVVRIKLPYKDSVTSSNQYIWLENHQVGSNGKLDFLQYSNITHYAYCRPQGAAGIYAYYQVGRDILEGTTNEVWDSCDRDNLRIIPAEGYYDFELVADTYPAGCVSNEPVTYAYRRGVPNPLCGGQDQEFQLFPLETDNVLYLSRELEPWRKVIDNQNYDCLPFLGDTMDAFRTHTKINMGTNPSTNNVKTYHSNNQNPSNIISAKNPEKNVQTTYLTGLSIEMTPVQGTGIFLVHVRWDDYNITNDTRWTGKISLKDTAVLTAGNTITLAQNRTVAQPTRDPETGLFAGRTRWTCENGSYFRQDSASALILTENSSVTFENGSRYDLSKDARVEIHAGCSLIVRPGAKIQMKGIVEVDSGGVLTLYDTAKMGNLSRLIVRPGGKLIVDGGTLTSACPNEMWQGIEVVGDRTKQQLAQYQGKVELKNGAVIENALCGIRTGLREDTEYITTGGIISAEDATFVNNCRAIEINSYAGVAPAGTVADNACGFENCTFTVGMDNHFAANNTAFTEHVRLWDVKGVKFKGCTFENQSNNMFGNGRGIYAEDAGLRLDVKCANNNVGMPGYCGCPPSYADSCLFNGFSTAVEINATGTPYTLTVNRVRFENNGTGVQINGNEFVTLTLNDFNLQRAPYTVSNCGVKLNGCTGYKVEGNRFHKAGKNILLSSRGVSVNNSGPSANSIYRNIFDTLDYGIEVLGANGGLQLSCDSFNYCDYDIYAYNGSIATSQGSVQQGADNQLVNTQVSSLYFSTGKNRIYHYSNIGFHTPYLPCNVSIDNTAEECGCASTLCDNGGGPYVPLTSFVSQVSAYASAVSGTDDDGLAGANDYPPLQTMCQTLSETYYNAVRALMSDTVLDLNELEQWHAAAHSANLANYANIGDPYSLTETRFMEGNSEPFTADAEDAEMANYAEFHALKLALRDNAGAHAGAPQLNSQNSQNSPFINWYALTDGQIAQLQTIAERNTGRASVMAKGVLCFFHGICYEDDLLGDDNADNQDNNMETRSAKVPQQERETNLTVYPNPADDVLFIELRGGAGIANVGLYDLQGRAVGTRFIASATGASATVNMRDVPAGVYVLRVTDTNGKEYHQKIVRK